MEKEKNKKRKRNETIYRLIVTVPGDEKSGPNRGCFSMCFNVFVKYASLEYFKSRKIFYCERNWKTKKDSIAQIM